MKAGGMKKVVLINPLIIHYTERPYLPHNLLYLGAAVQHRRDVVVEIVDYNVGDSVDRFFGDDSVLFYGLGTQSGSQLRSAELISRHIRRHAGATPIVWGGVHPTLAPRETIREPYVDVVVKGEAELTLNRLIDAYLAGGTLESIDGLVYQASGGQSRLPVLGPTREGWEIAERPKPPALDMNGLSPLPYHLVDVPAYKNDVLWVISSRSCPFKCKFCVAAGMNEKWRAMSPEAIMLHLEHALRHVDARGVYFMDYNFFVDHARVRRLAELLIESRLGIPWLAQITGSDASKLDLETIRLLKRSGCITLTAGQDAAKSIMKQIRKPATHDQIQTAERVLASEGLPFTRNFIIGHPGETRKDLQDVIDDIDAIERTYGDFINLYVFTVFPGTPVVDDIKAGKFAYELPASTREWSSVIFGDPGRLTFHPPGYQALVRTVYYTIRTLREMTVLPMLADPDRPDAPRRFSAAERVLLSLLRACAYVRWRLKFFRLGVEWKLLHRLVERKYDAFYRQCEDVVVHARRPVLSRGPAPRRAAGDRLQIGWSAAMPLKRTVGEPEPVSSSGD